jgi:tetraacyldisaccharide 4'-kinase
MQEFSPTVFVLDDGFQHRSAARDLDIVCIDATNPFGNDRFLPAGRLRESSSNLKRAHAAVLTRADLAHDLTGLETRVRDLAPQIEIFHARYTFRGFTELGSQKPVDTSEISSRPVYAFCGLGDPANFFSQLAKQGVRSVGNRAFPDHHFYTDADVRQIDSDASDAGADLLITTAKDAVRLETRMPTMRCLIAEIEIEITDDDLFRRLIFSF